MAGARTSVYVLLAVLLIGAIAYFAWEQEWVVWYTDLEAQNPGNVSLALHSGYVYVADGNAFWKLDPQDGNILGHYELSSLLGIRQIAGASGVDPLGLIIVYRHDSSSTVRVASVSPEQSRLSLFIPTFGSDVGWDDIGYFILDPYRWFVVTSGADRVLNVRVIVLPSPSFIAQYLSTAHRSVSEGVSNHTFFGLTASKAFVSSAGMLDYDTVVVGYTRVGDNAGDLGACVIYLPHNRPVCHSTLQATRTYSLSDIAVDPVTRKIYLAQSGPGVVILHICDENFSQCRRVDLSVDVRSGLSTKLFFGGRYLYGVYVSSGGSMKYFVYDTNTGDVVSGDYFSGVPSGAKITGKSYTSGDLGNYLVSMGSVRVWRLSGLPFDFGSSSVQILTSGDQREGNVSITFRAEASPGVYGAVVNVYRLRHVVVRSGFPFPTEHHLWYWEPYTWMVREYNGESSITDTVTFNLPAYTLPLPPYAVEGNAPYRFRVTVYSLRGASSEDTVDLNVLPAPPGQPSGGGGGGAQVVEKVVVKKRAADYTGRATLSSGGPLSSVGLDYVVPISFVLVVLLIYIFAR